jgi:methylmalonyl-CoA mutase
MDEKLNLRKHFSPTSREEWVARIEKDLKGRSFKELQFAISEEIRLDPLYHRQDHSKLPEIELWKNTSGWEIGEQIHAGDPVEANAIALQALQMGAESILFDNFTHSPSADQLSVLLKEIQPNYISLGIGLSDERVSPEALLTSLQEYLANKKALNGHLYLQRSVSGMDDQVFNRISEMSEAFPGSRLLQIDLRKYHQGSEKTSLEVREGIKQGMNCLERMGAKARPEKLYFTLSVGKDYFAEMAKLRALRWLWPKAQKAAGLEDPAPAFIQVHFTPDAYTEDTYLNMIRATTMAMSAILGGADRLFVLPADHHSGQTSTFTRRIARNVQHILKLESHFAKVEDPAAGSYFIDQLTYETAEKAWEHYK